MNKKFLLLVFLLISVAAFSACNNKGANDGTTSTEQAEYVPGADLESLGVSTPEITEEADIDTLLGSEEISDSWANDDFNFSGSDLPEDETQNTEFDYGTPLETGGVTDNALPLEVGLPLETGADELTSDTLTDTLTQESTDNLSQITPIETQNDSDPDNIPLVVNEAELNSQADEELKTVPEDLAKTDDMVSGLSIAIGVFFLFAILIISLKRNRVSGMSQL